MIPKIDTSHRYSKRVRHVRPTIFVGVGGLGREMARAAMRETEAHFGSPVPFAMLVELDLCDETGRALEPVFHPRLSGTQMTFIAPGVDCAAAVAEHGGNPELAWWNAVDPEAIKHIGDTGKLGGYAAPQAARFVLEFHNEKVEEFCLAVTNRADAMLLLQLPEWEVSGPLQLVLFNSINGAVGSTALHVKDRFEVLLRRPNLPVRILQVAALLADRGRVINRAQARALQQSGLTEVFNRSLAW